MYDTNAPKLVKISPYSNPNTKTFYGFSLSNSQNLALAVSAYPFMLPGAKAQSLDFYLESPDLLGNQDWKSAKGYSLDLQRNFLSLCADPPLYMVQLQVQMWDTQQKKMRIFAEQNPKTQQFVVHTIQPYHFIWTPEVFVDFNLALRVLRIRFSQPNFSVPGSGKCLPKGAWLIGSIQSGG